jgi:hypothetical protein
MDSIQSLRTVGVERFDSPGRHPEVESRRLRRAQCHIAESHRRRGDEQLHMGVPKTKYAYMICL